MARTCSTSEVPIPKASAPKAPWVEVWESKKRHGLGIDGKADVNTNEKLTSTDDGRSRKSETLLRSNNMDDSLKSNAARQ